ncbi:hypothetical protein L3Q82_023166 [Scortum barcoo]|uniref:Uncharacterized protein n=1 Tax=Scortum barcoo TaxID=214431 RepID=A0ACB8WZ20_9TELE|nr:hypothetical protein L3Q82_023166 [Scortum barcoo]
MSHREEASGKTQDTLEKLCLWLRLAWERLGVPPEELEEVSGVREVWASLLRLLPPRPVICKTLTFRFQVFQTMCDNILYFSIELGLRCYSCVNSITPSCPNSITCSDREDRCATVKVNIAVAEVFTLCLADLYNKGCLNNALCGQGADCCRGDLCNGAIPTGSSVLVLLVSPAIITVFL